jgi:hypothetical protein
MTIINWQQLWDDYLPLENQIDKNASLDGYMFETYGEDLAFVRAKDENNIWTYVDDGDGGEPEIVPGFRTVNRLGYLVTEKSHEGEDIQVVDF